ncbi:tetratricopeptide repeat protein [Sinorhizobium medicae]|uniref:Tetratricopeptide TPR_4 n=2 Tax=Sinorhizobium medicae TaxID=110321 RepID=A0A508WXM2_9HYPH|nr:tetratricopeptide repeat protein [Sinorhizobium medicae]ABR61670.1 Tetratricopeptide TPR_4 [Sinorhizobium medicae WSM419]MBO1959343.1 tetratricopeptide repeat protein [Sinorhizobium medicae]MDX0405396.1 tetratricopeptide repeat protein [Sinorhizobium medicae]MDX0410620.1 tetratricopeptide repeat protein [Sinorhizobium medicae]MDX0417046.1 tetratricopeptide repeat protein [Sinorhizobium medicae]
MTVHVIDCIEEFKQSHRNWNKIYRSDSEAHAFLSWPWLNEYLPRRERWLILAWKHSSAGKRYDAFLPLELATSQDENTGIFVDEILMIGNHGTGRTGFLCAPGLENEAADAFAGILAAENWTSIRFDHCGQASARLDRLLGAFSDGTFARVDTADEGERIDSCGRRLETVLLRTLTGRNLHDCLNHRSLGLVLERAVALHAFGDFDGAEAGYRQLIRTVPGHVEARFRLAHLLNDVGEYDEAEHFYRTLLPTVPNPDDVLHWIGDTQMAQGFYRKASKTFQELLVRHPQRGAVRYKLAVAHLASGRRDAAVAAFESFDDVLSDDTNHVLCRAKAQEILSRLKDVAGMGEQDGEEQHDQKGQPSLSWAPFGDEPSETAQSFAARLEKSGQPLLSPSLPPGTSARLHAGLQLFRFKGWKMKH